MSEKHAINTPNNNKTGEGGRISVVLVRFCYLCVCAKENQSDPAGGRRWTFSNDERRRVVSRWEAETVAFEIGGGVWYLVLFLSSSCLPPPSHSHSDCLYVRQSICLLHPDAIHTLLALASFSVPSVGRLVGPQTNNKGLCFCSRPSTHWYVVCERKRERERGAISTTQWGHKLLFFFFFLFFFPL